MRETEPYVASRCTTPACTRLPYREGECWLCPDCSRRLRAAALEALAVLTQLADSAAYWSEYDVPVGIVSEIDSAKARLAGVLDA